MAEPPILSSAVNVSEGKDPQVIARLADAAGAHTALLDLSSDLDHNRTVLTLCGRTAGLIEAVAALSAVAIASIDIRVHAGVHPRLGAVDVVPFTPRPGTSMASAQSTARSCAERLWSELEIPSFLYESSAQRPEATRLPDVRRQAFKTLFPDVGGPAPHPSAGAVVIGARGPLVAFNVNLASDDVAAARAIASAIRSGKGALPGVRALGLLLESRDLAQVSMNLTRPDLCSVAQAYRHVESLAAENAIAIESSEIVGVVGAADLGTSDPSSLQLRAEPKTFELLVRNRVRSLGTSG